MGTKKHLSTELVLDALEMMLGWRSFIVEPTPIKAEVQLVASNIQLCKG